MIGAHVAASETLWLPNEASRRSEPLSDSGGIVVNSAIRMPFEQQGVMWQLDFTNPSAVDVKISLDLELSAAVAKYQSVGDWSCHSHLFALFFFILLLCSYTYKNT